MNRVLLIVAMGCAAALAATDIWDVRDPHQPFWLGACLAALAASFLVDR